MSLFPEPRQLVLCRASLGVVSVLLGAPLQAAELFQDGGWQARLDTMVRYSAGVRLDHADPARIADPNSDDADRNFKPGLMSNRIDLVSQFDLSREHFGLDASAAAWFDSVYFGRTANDSPETYNPASVPNSRFTHAVQALDGRKAELLNAFLHGDFDAAGMPVSFRIGRHTLLWGESLFFAENGIAAGQAPIDAIKAAGAPLAQAREVFMPVGQASVSIQPMQNFAIDAYYQFEWRPTRVPGVGSYFSTVDFLDAGGERLISGTGQYIGRTADRTPHANDQFGVGFRLSGTVDYGLYALRYNAKDPEVVVSPDQHAYWLTYPSGIEVYGASFSGYLGDDNVAGEVSARRYMPLVSRTLQGQPGFTGSGFYTIYALKVASETSTASPYAGAAYATGDTLHGQISWLSSKGPSKLWDAADLSAELAANQLLDVGVGEAAIDRTRSHFAAAFRAVFAPHYFQVLPGLDLTLPIGLGYDPIGRSSVDGTMNARTGSLTLGVDAVFRTVWEADISYTRFLGPPTRQPFADRSFVVFSIQRSF